MHTEKGRATRDRNRRGLQHHLQIAVMVLMAMMPATKGFVAPAESPTAAQPSPGSAAIAKAAANKRYLFIFFHSANSNAGNKFALFGRSRAEQTAALKASFDAATQKAGDRAESVAIDISDPAEKDVVKRFDVSRSPMPMVLVLAPNGAITGGFPGKFTEEQILGAVTTPAMAKCLKTLQDRKLVFLCVQNDKTRGNDEAMRGVKDFKADQKYGSATEIITVDPADKAEAATLGKFHVDPSTKDAVTVFIAPPGTTIATFQGATDKKTLVAKLTAAVASCGSGCGPSGCGPAQ
ncbi:MAG: hypothetical protein K1X53_05390 [Candidatus Sumerlaeaceae bacterium]|nr:hypothetical protein [Candidatus Sumerlaeaceae bacterium]